MGNLLFIIRGMEVSAVPEDQRDNSVKELAEVVSYAHKESDKCCMEKGMGKHEFKYGNFFLDFVYAEWSRLCKKDELKGIQQKTLQLLQNTCADKPSLGKEISPEEFDSYEMPSARAGLNIPDIGIKDYIYNYPDWKNKKLGYLQLHQNEIDWKKAENNFLPFRSFSDNILVEEIKRHGMEKELKDGEATDSHAIANVFHEKIMRNKGNALFVYAREIGERICFANAYIFDDKLSRAESKATKQNRYIYRLLNSDKEMQYISIDTRHGMFEFHDKNGDHLGEYRFNGEFNSGAESDHSLKSIRKRKN